MTNEETKKYVSECTALKNSSRTKALQAETHYKSRAGFLKEVLNPLIENGIVYRDGNAKSPTAVIKLIK